MREIGGVRELTSSGRMGVAVVGGGTDSESTTASARVGMVGRGAHVVWGDDRARVMLVGRDASSGGSTGERARLAGGRSSRAVVISDRSRRRSASEGPATLEESIKTSVGRTRGGRGQKGAATAR